MCGATRAACRVNRNLNFNECTSRPQLQVSKTGRTHSQLGANAEVQSGGGESGIRLRLHTPVHKHIAFASNMEILKQQTNTY